MLYITALTASILGALVVMLSLNVVGIRRKQKVSVGDGDLPELQRAIRAQGNMIEYAPIGLILLACAELNGVPRIIVAILAIAFVAGRVLHPAGIKQDGNMKARVLGMQLTLVTILVLAAVNVLWLVWLLVT